MPDSLCIAIVGAESTGKSQLAADLKQVLQSLQADLPQGFSVAVVPEVLRRWCDEQNRVPTREEQWWVAREQERLIEQAAQQHDVVLADTTSLMTAVYSEHVYRDDSLYPFAQLAQNRYALHLVTGLDIEWVADGIQRDGPHVREQVDQRVRSHLSRWQLPHVTVWGLGSLRCNNALRALAPLLKQHLKLDIGSLLGDSARLEGRGWNWVCERCSDGACEHQLFRQLLKTGR